jgi:hypothetical protein
VRKDAPPTSHTLESCEPWYEPGFALHLAKLLHLTKAVEQSLEGMYHGQRRYLKDGDVLAHLNGEKTLAFSVVHRRKANAIVLDVDAEFPERLPIIRDALIKLGLAKASFATNGSGPQKGKVIITLVRAMPQADAIALVNRIVDECVKNVFFGGRDKLDLRPTAGEGGLIRIAGRNRVRNGPLEIFLTLDGMPTDLSAVVPFSFKKQPVRIEPAKISADVGRYLKNGIPRDTPHERIVRIVSFLAHEAIKKGGSARAESVLANWLETIARASPEIADGDTTKKDVLDPRQAAYFVAHAWEVRQQRDEWTPLHLVAVKTPKTGFRKFEIRQRANDKLLGTCSAPVGRLYQRLCEYAKVKGANRASISMDAETLSDYLGKSPRQTRRTLKEACSVGVLRVVSSSGFTAGARPPPNVYALISESEYMSPNEQRDAS